LFLTWTIESKRILLTGGNCGIGKAAAEELCRRGAEVVITVRSEAKGEEAVASIREGVPGAEVSWRLLDLGRRDSIEACATGVLADFDRLDVLVHNAGLVLSSRRELEGGVEATFGINHLGPFLLTRRLEPLMRESAPARVVVVASAAHKRVPGLDFDDLQATRGYSTRRAYCASKLANVLFTRELARRFEGSGVTANSLHPGVVATRFARDGDAPGAFGLFFALFGWALLSPEEGARTTVHLAAAPELEGTSGEYFARCRPAPTSRAGADDEAARRLWEESERLLGLGESPRT